MTETNRLAQILKSIEQISIYMRDRPNLDSFRTDPMCQDAVLMQLIVIGETAYSLPEEFRTNYSVIPWYKMIGMRNIIAHGYVKVDLDIVWGVIKKDLPELQLLILKIIEESS